MLRPGVRERMTKERDDVEKIEAMIADSRLFLKYLDEQGVDAAAVINYPAHEVMGFTDQVNDYVAEFARRNPTRILAVGGVDARHEKRAADHVKALHAKGVRALKIHPPHQLYAANAYVDGGWRSLREIYSEAQELGMPVIIHTGTSVFPGARNRFGDPMAIDDVALDYPQLKIVMAHGGRPLYMDKAFFILRRHENVHLDISSIPPKSLLEYFPRFTEIASRAMFGSDWPGPGAKSIKGNVDAFKDLKFDEKTQRAVLYENAARLFNLESSI